MKKLKIIALAVAIVLIFSGCSMFSVNQERYKNQTVATVNGVPITRHQVEFEAKNSQAYTEAMYYYGYYYGYTEEDLKTEKELKDWYKGFLSSTLDQMVINELMVQKAPELGIALTDEEKQEQRTAADKAFANAKDQIRSEVEQELAASASPSASVSPEASTSPVASVSPEASPSPSATVDPVVEAKVEEKYQEMLSGAEFTPDTYYDYLCKQKLITKVKDYIDKQTVVTDDDVSKWYNDSVTSQQLAMDLDPTVFATNMNNNQICVYIPEDTVAVKHVLIKYKDQDLAEVATELYNAGKKDEAMKLLQGQIADLMPTMRDIQQRLKNGESIDSLIAEFGEDPGMTSGMPATIGYLVGASTTTYVTEFSEAALKLTAAGNVSDPVATYMGVQVLQAVKIYKKGVVPSDELKDAIKTALLPIKQQEKYKELTGQWKDASNITYDKGRLYN